MLGLPPDQVIPFATFIGYGILGGIAALGVWWGKRKPAGERTAEVVGALVDSGAIKLLAEAVDTLTDEHAKNRAVAHKMVDALDDAGKELSELRRELRALGDSLRQS